jgi:heme A synthase
MTRLRAHHLATATAAVTFCLLLLGNVVWGTGSSLACPDWPTCYGSFFPEMRGGILYEHSHRLLGATVGLLTIATAAALTLQKASRRLRIAGFAAIGIVIVQGVLGGLTVLLRLPALVSVAHLTTAMIFFSLLVWIAWASRGSTPKPDAPRVRWVTLAYAATFLQIVLGGVVRHTGAAAACTEIPLCIGSVWPSGAHPTAYVHMTHRLAALVVTAVVLAAAWSALRSPGKTPLSGSFAWGAVGLIGVQIGIGLLVVLSGLDVGIVTAHLGAGALLLADLLLLRLALGSERREPSPGRQALLACNEGDTISA